MKLNQDGYTGSLLPHLIVVVLLLILSLVFGLWAFSGRQNYKNNTNQLIATAVSAAKQQQTSSDNSKFALAEEQPLITYSGPQAYGSLIVNYPRTWSSFVNTSGGNSPVDGYFYPGTLPADSDNGSTNFALRVQVTTESYSSLLSQYSGQQQSGLVTVSPYSLPKVPNVVGVEIVGQLAYGRTGTLVMLPLRSQALEVWTEGSQYLNDFNNNILPNLSFSP